MEEELKKFIKDLKIIEETMYDVSAEKNYPLDKKFLKALDRFHENIMMCATQAKNTDLDLFSNYNSFLHTSEIEYYVASILVILNKIKRMNEVPLVSQNLLDNSKKLFHNIIKLKGFVRILLKEYINLHRDNELFRPVDIDKQKAITSLDNAMRELKKITNIDQGYKKNILIYINEIKIDLNKENPPWSTIFGKLNIVSVIITIALGAGPIATYIDDAYKSIMGSSFKSPIQKEYIYQKAPPQIEDKTVIDTEVV